MAGEEKIVYDAKEVKRFLESNRQQTTISLAYFSLDQAGLEETAKFIRDNPFVKYFDVRGNDIQARGITALANGIKVNRSMRALNLKWNSIGKDHAGLAHLCEALKANLTIKTVDLSKNHIDSAGSKHIAEMLKTNSTITRIDLSWNNLNRDGGVVLLDALKKNTSLIECHLSGSKCGEDVLHEVAFFLRRNRAKARKEAEELGPPADARPAEPEGGPKGKAGYKEAEEPPVAEETVWRPRTLQEDRAIMLRILMRERDQPLPDDKVFYREIAEFIDSLLLEAEKHKQAKADGEERERLSCAGYEERVERYLREIYDTEEGIKQTLVDTGALEVEVSRQRWDLGELNEENEKEKREIVLSKERGDREEKELTQEVKDLYKSKWELHDKLALNQKDLELLEEENERLRDHVEEFKKHMEAILGERIQDGGVGPDPAAQQGGVG